LDRAGGATFRNRAEFLEEASRAGSGASASGLTLEAGADRAARTNYGYMFS